jgi:hypothetical protein
MSYTSYDMFRQHKAIISHAKIVSLYALFCVTHLYSMSIFVIICSYKELKIFKKLIKIYISVKILLRYIRRHGVDIMCYYTRSCAYSCVTSHYLKQLRNWE